MPGGGGSVSPYYGVYGEAPLERDALSGFRYMKGREIGHCGL